MVELVLTPKSLNSGIVGGTLPTVEASINSTSFTELTLGGTLDVHIPDDVYYTFTPYCENSHATYFLTIEIRESDGVTVIDTFTMGDTSTHNVRHDTGMRFHNDGKYSNKTGLRIFVKTQHASHVQKIYVGGLIWAYAPHINITDILNTKMHINNLKMLECDSVDEGSDCVVSSNKDLAFTDVHINSVKSGLIFSANSGKMLFDWDGYNIGVSP